MTAVERNIRSGPAERIEAAVKGLEVTSTPSDAAPTVVLWDVDNVDPGLAGTREAGALLIALAGSNTYQLASGHPTIIGRRKTTLHELGYVILPAKAASNSADAHLMQAAGWLCRHAGVERFVLASGDHWFWPLARMADVTGVARSTKEVSRALARRATRVLTL